MCHWRRRSHTYFCLFHHHTLVELADSLLNSLLKDFLFELLESVLLLGYISKGIYQLNEFPLILFSKKREMDRDMVSHFCYACGTSLPVGKDAILADDGRSGSLIPGRPIYHDKWRIRLNPTDFNKLYFTDLFVWGSFIRVSKLCLYLRNDASQASTHVFAAVMR